MLVVYGSTSFFIKPYSEYHECSFEIEFIPCYGFVAPGICTTNGQASLIKQFIDSKEHLQLFEEFVCMCVGGD